MNIHIHGIAFSIHKGLKFTGCALACNVNMHTQNKAHTLELFVGCVLIIIIIIIIIIISLSHIIKLCVLDIGLLFVIYKQ